MGGLRDAGGNGNGLRRAGGHASATTNATIGCQLRQGRTAEPRAEADRAFRAGIAAALADDAATGEACRTDRRHMVEGGDGAVKDRLGAGIGTGAAEAALVPREIEGRPAGLVECDDVLRAGGHTSAAPATSRSDRPGAGPRRANPVGQ